MVPPGGPSRSNVPPVLPEPVILIRAAEVNPVSKNARTTRVLIAENVADFLGMANLRCKTDIKDTEAVVPEDSGAETAEMLSPRHR